MMQPYSQNGSPYPQPAIRPAAITMARKELRNRLFILRTTFSNRTEAAGAFRAHRCIVYIDTE